MSQITRLVLADATEQCARWRAEGIDMTVSVNVSVPVLLEAGFPELVRGYLDARTTCRRARSSSRSPRPASSPTSTRPSGSSRNCRTLGIVVSIDDFGAGFTSLAHLSGLAVKELKLDRSFIVKLTEQRHPTRPGSRRARRSNSGTRSACTSSPRASRTSRPSTC